MRKDISKTKFNKSKTFTVEAKILAKKKCKNCWGRGYIKYDLGRYTPVRYRFCGCTEKKKVK